jgi:hypothetical protein
MAFSWRKPAESQLASAWPGVKRLAYQWRGSAQRQRKSSANDLHQQQRLKLSAATGAGAASRWHTLAAALRCNGKHQSGKRDIS